MSDAMSKTLLATATSIHKASTESARILDLEILGHPDVPTPVRQMLIQIQAGMRAQTLYNDLLSVLLDELAAKDEIIINYVRSVT